MSDVTETVLERSLPAYQDLVQRRLFTAEEVRALVEARRGFEYKLQRRAARKADYQRYIDHELKVESLRKLRRRRLGLQKRTLSDFSQTQHVFFIYDRGVRKFPADLDFWLQYLDFAQGNGGEKRLGRLFSQALQLHPREPLIWIRAASWQFFRVNNAKAARVLLQRAIRINPGAASLWHEYFRLELFYVLKLAGRKRVLGIDPAGNGVGSGQAKGPGEAFYSGAVPLAVFGKAIEEIPHDLAFRVAFLEICEGFDGTQHVMKRILDG